MLDLPGHLYLDPSTLVGLERYGRRLEETLALLLHLFTLLLRQIVIGARTAPATGSKYFTVAHFGAHSGTHGKFGRHRATLSVAFLGASSSLVQDLSRSAIEELLGVIPCCQREPMALNSWTLRGVELL